MEKCFFIVILLANVSLLFAQDSDLGLWTSIDIEKKLSEKWKFGVEAQYRWKDDISVTDQIRGGANVSRKLGNYVKLGAGYELIADKKVKRDIFKYRNRFKVQAIGSYKYARFTASYRTQMQLTMMETDEPRGNIFEDDSYKWVWRNRFGLKYDIKNVPLKPYINIELFHHLFSSSDPIYYQNRLSVGIEYKLAKHHSIEAGYKFNTEIDAKTKNKCNIIKIGYAFSF